METRGQPSTEGEQEMKIQEYDEWMTPIIHYLKKSQLSEDRNEARKVQFSTAHFVLIDDTFYKRGSSLPYLRCVNKEEANYVL